VFSIIFKKYDSGNRHDREKRLILERERERERERNDKKKCNILLLLENL
jgi:hypothetical protein